MKLPNGKLSALISSHFYTICYIPVTYYMYFICAHIALRFTVRFPSAQATNQTPCLPVRRGRAYRLLLHGYTY